MTTQTPRITIKLEGFRIYTDLEILPMFKMYSCAVEPWAISIMAYSHHLPVGLDPVMNVYVDVIGNEFFLLFSFITNILYKS